MRRPFSPIRFASLLLGLLALCLLALPAAASDDLETPQINAPVVDRVGVGTMEQRNRFSAKLRHHYEQTGVQMAVLFVESTGSEPIEDFSLRVAQTWEGGSAARDDGILLVFAIEDRRNRLELGYGIEPLISDGDAARMLREVRPLLQRERYLDAADAVVDQVIARTQHLEPAAPIRGGSHPRSVLLWTVALLIFALAQGLVWRMLQKGDLEPNAPKLDVEDDEDSSEVFNKRLPLYGQFLFWLIPPVLVVVYFDDQILPPHWDPLGGLPMTAWGVFLLALGPASAGLIRIGGKGLWCVVMFFVFHALIAAVALEWIETASMMEVSFFGVWALIIDLIFWVGTFAMMMDGGGGSYSSGGGGSFGGGGASGSW